MTSPTGLDWQDRSASDGDEYWAEGAPDASLHAFIFKSSDDDNPVIWEVSDLSNLPVRPAQDSVIAEGSCPTVRQAKAEAEAFIRSMLVPTSEELGEAKRGLLAVVAALAEPFE